VAPGTGVLLAAAPGLGAVQPPLYAAGIAHNPSIRAFRAAVSGSGQAAAAVAAGVPLAGMIRGQTAPASLAAVPEPGRTVAVGCPRYLPGQPEACSAVADPRGAGLAMGATER
jgi:gamma-glutamyltranspeptidase/glutathione hydrolase